jgi:outer membrane protein assembly factor BamB
LWQVQPGSRPYINTDGTQRGLAYNALSGHVLVVSRSGSNGVHVLNADTGAHLWSLNTDPSIITGGTFALNLVAVDGQGRVFGCNLTTGGTTDPFKLYRWDSDAPDAVPVQVYSGDPGNGDNQRWGDNLAIRFQDVETQVLIGSRNGRLAAIIQPDFGGLYAVFNIPNIVAGGLGLGVAFGAGDTFWGKSSGNPLYEIAFDVNTSTASAIRTNATVSAMINIAVDPVHERLAGNFLQTPDNVRLYQYGPGSLAELDTEFYATDNPNPNGSGALAFGPNRLYALDANNGIMAFAVSPRLRWDWNGTTLTLSWDSPFVLQSAPAVTGTYTDVPGAASPYMVPGGGGNLFFRLRD